MKLRLVLFYIMGYTLLTAQSRNLSYYGNNLRDHLLIKQQDMVGRVTNEDIEGSPYFIDSFVTSTVFTDKILYNGIPIRYNIHEGYMEFKDNGSTFILDPKPEIKKIELNGSEISVEPYIDGGNVKLGYFILLDSNGIKLLKRKQIRFQERIPAQALQSKATPAKYLPKPDEFYYRIPGQAAKLIINVKKMIEQFPSHQKALLSYASRHKINDNEEELKALWAYYTKLTSK